MTSGHDFQVMGEGTKREPRFLRCKRCKHVCGLLGTVIPCSVVPMVKVTEGVYKR